MKLVNKLLIINSTVFKSTSSAADIVVTSASVVASPVLHSTTITPKQTPIPQLDGFHDYSSTDSSCYDDSSDDEVIIVRIVSRVSNV